MKEMLAKRKPYKEYLQKYINEELTLYEFNRAVEAEGLYRKEIYPGAKSFAEVCNELGMKQLQYMEMGLYPDGKEMPKIMSMLYASVHRKAHGEKKIKQV